MPLLCRCQKHQLEVLSRTRLFHGRTLKTRSSRSRKSNLAIDAFVDSQPQHLGSSIPTLRRPKPTNICDCDAEVLKTMAERSDFWTRAGSRGGMGELLRLDEVSFTSSVEVSAYLKEKTVIATRRELVARQSKSVLIPPVNNIYRPTIPHDILLKIIDYCSSLYHDVDFPIVASHVCQEWRELVLSSPTLWTYIPIYCTGSSRTHHESLTLLERSRDTPIVMHILMSRPLNQFERTRLILPHINRIETLILEVMQDVGLPTIWQEYIYTFPALTRFEMHAQGQPFVMVDVIVDPERPFRLPPAHPADPKYLMWDEWDVKLKILSFFFPTFEHHQYAPDFAEIYRLLDKNRTSLENIELMSLRHIPNANEPHPVLEFPKLQTLLYGYVYLDDTEDKIFADIHAPELTTLTLRDLVRCPNTEFAVRESVPVRPVNRRLADFIFAGLCSPERMPNIQELTLEGVVVTNGFLLYKTFQNLPRLRTLILYDTNELIFTVFHNACNLKPWTGFIGRVDANLESLTVTHCVREHMLDYISSRQEAGLPKLKTLAINTVLEPLLGERQFGSGGAAESGYVTREDVRVMARHVNVIAAIERPITGIVRSEYEIVMARDGRIFPDRADEFRERHGLPLVGSEGPSFEEEDLMSVDGD